MTKKWKKKKKKSKTGFYYSAKEAKQKTLTEALNLASTLDEAHVQVYPIHWELHSTSNCLVQAAGRYQSCCTSFHYTLPFLGELSFPHNPLPATVILSVLIHWPVLFYGVSPYFCGFVLEIRSPPWTKKGLGDTTPSTCAVLRNKGTCVKHEAELFLYGVLGSVL